MSDRVAIILEVQAATNNGELSIVTRELFVEINHLKNALVDTMDCGDSHSYPWQYGICLPIANPITTFAKFNDFLHAGT